MKSLLSEIKDTLETMSQMGGDTGNCYITPDARWRPEGVADTSIGIRPENLSRQELGGGKLEISATVEVSCYMPLTADAETVLCGSSGLYDFADDAQALLTDNLLGLNDVQAVQVGTEDGLMMVAGDGENRALVRLARQYIYTMERDE